ncbi:hypothetical protein ACLBR5_17180 [Escherichia coli]
MQAKLLAGKHRRFVNWCGVIGHGVKAIEDRVLNLSASNKLVLNPSDLQDQTSSVAELAAHPLKTFLEHGIRASINTDDPGVQGVDIIHEYTVAAPAARVIPRANPPGTD